jgi:YidC/Oxa1 family membrane protein insertase
MNTEKRLLLALALSFIVLAVWSNFAVKPKAPATPAIPLEYAQKPGITQKTSLEMPVKPAATATQVALPFEFTQGQRKYVFDEPRAVLKEVIFSGYKSYVFLLKNGLQFGENDLAYKRQTIGNNTVIYTFSDNEKKITKRFVFSESGYDFEYLLSIENLSASPLSLKMPVYLGTIDPSLSKDRMSFHDVAVLDTEKMNYPNFQKSASFNQLKFIGLRDRYFSAIIEPSQAGFAGFIDRTESKESLVGLLAPELKIVPRGTWEEKFRVYIGPQDAKILKSLNPDWQSVIYFGKLDLIAQGLLMLIEFFYSFTHSWGWVIVFLSLLIYLVLYPLTMKQMRSMKEMQVLQPKIEELRARFKNDAQGLNKEIMELYRTHKVNPFSGCLPMILQIPIFFALYQVLTRTVALKGASFFWMKDLSEPDRLFTFSQNFPLIGTSSISCQS